MRAGDTTLGRKRRKKNKNEGKGGREGNEEGRRDRKKRKYSHKQLVSFKGILKRIILNTLLEGQMAFYFMNLYLLCIDVCAC